MEWNILGCFVVALFICLSNAERKVISDEEIKGYREYIEESRSKIDLQSPPGSMANYNESQSGALYIVINNYSNNKLGNVQLVQPDSSHDPPKCKVVQVSSKLC